jgi:hypothetical protein
VTPVDRVSVYSSYAYAVEPRAFYFEEIRHNIKEIERAWKSPGRLHFHVRDEYESCFELVYEEANDRWFLRTFGETCRVVSLSTTR